MNLKGKKILVTGASGFVGSHLTEKLISLGASVRAFLHYNSRGEDGNLKWIPEDVRRNIEFFYGELRELETVHDAVKGVDVIFNLAALVGIPYSYKHPQEVLETNTVGTMNILISARKEGVERIVQTSTSEVYGTACYVPIDEKHPRQPQSPYSASKIAADAFALSFYHSFKLPVSVIRPFNTYGPRQSDRAVIPAVISQVLTQNELSLGTTTTTRDFTFVLDLVDAFIRVAEVDEAIGKEINIGSGKEISIGDLIQKILSIVDRDVKLIEDPSRLRPSGSEVERLLADTTLAKKILNWEANTSLDRGLEIMVEWTKNFIKHYKPDQYNI